jgi:2-hydroxychromene-2-carboxylate isomerase
MADSGQKGKVMKQPILTITKHIVWYYDFISPYAYLQCHKLNDFADHATIECRPILFAGLLHHWGQLGPAEIVPKRLWTFQQVAFLAHRHNIPIKMPAMHPFNPLPMLRLAVTLAERHQNSIANTQKLFDFIWQEGHLPTDTTAFSALLDSFELTQADIETPIVKAQLKSNGEAALADSLFGVPTSVIDGRRFWGFDSGEMLHSYLNNDPFWNDPLMKAATDMPQGLQRARRPSL